MKKLIFLALILAGCGGKEVIITEYQDVYIPVPCELPTPKRPTFNGDAVYGILAITEYAKALEITLAACQHKNTTKEP